MELEGKIHPKCAQTTVGNNKKINKGKNFFKFPIITSFGVIFYQKVIRKRKLVNRKRKDDGNKKQFSHVSPPHFYDNPIKLPTWYINVATIQPRRRL